MNMGMKIDAGIKMNGVLIEMKAWITKYNWMHKMKCLNEKYIHKYTFLSYQKEVNGKYLESSDIQHTVHVTW